MIWPVIKALGISSNRKIETLERLIDLLDDPAYKVAAQKLLARYTDVYKDNKTSEQWHHWLTELRNRIFFSDFGGYKFLVVPKGYLTASPK